MSRSGWCGWNDRESTQTYASKYEDSCLLPLNMDEPVSSQSFSDRNAEISSLRDLALGLAAYSVRILGISTFRTFPFLLLLFLRLFLLPRP